MRRPSLTPSSREAAWRLLLEHWRTAPGLSDPGFRLGRQRLAAGDRHPDLLAALGREYLNRKIFDAESVEPLAALAAGEGELAEAARRGVVRCDARLCRFVPERLDWYRWALAEGSISAAFVLSIGALGGQLHDPALAAAALRRALARASEDTWRAAGLDRAQALAQLADWHATQPPSDDGRAAVEAALRQDPERLDWLRWLAAALRPAVDKAALRVYLALFRRQPDEPGNTGFLAAGVLAGTLLDVPRCDILAAWLALSPPDPETVRLALACAAVEEQREDARALEWLRATADRPAAPPEVRGWLARLEARAGAADDAALARFRAALDDSALPREWRAEAGVALCRALHTAGRFDEAAFAATWTLLPADHRPAWLATDLARHYAAAGRTDAATVTIYRDAYHRQQTPELSRLLAHAYLADDSTPLRERMAHWRDCQRRGESDQAIAEALARAYASEGQATEAAIFVVENIPAPHRVRLLDELVGLRFERGDYASAEAMAGALARLEPANPDVLYKLLLCRVRRALDAHEPLDRVDLGAVRDHPYDQRLQALASLVEAASGQRVPPPQVAQAAETLGATGGDEPGLAAAVAELRGEHRDLNGVESDDPRQTWLLATVEAAHGHLERARRRLERSGHTTLRQWERVLAARQQWDAGRPEEVWPLLMPCAAKQRPPWLRLRAVLLDLGLRRAPEATLAKLQPHMAGRRRQVAELRLLAELDRRGDESLWPRLYALDESLDPAGVRAFREAVVWRHAHAHLLAGRVEQAESLLADLRRSDSAGDAGLWLSAVVAHARGHSDRAMGYAAAMSEAARSRPAVAWALAAWLLADSQPSRAETALHHALDAQPDDLELLYAVSALNAQLQRRERFLPAAERLLQRLPAGDPRRSDVELAWRVLRGELTQVDTAALVADLATLPADGVLLRLELLLAVAVDHLGHHDPAAAAELLRQRLEALRGFRLPSAAAPAVAELQNAWAYALFLAGRYETAVGVLRAVQPRSAPVAQNLGVVAHVAGDSAEAARRLEEALAASAALPYERVAPDWRARIEYHAHRQLADIHREGERWTDELKHLEACLAQRPLDVDLQHACIQPLLALGETDKALHKSSWLLTQRPNDLTAHLDHASVLVSARGVAAALTYLDDLATRRPESGDAIAERKGELKERLLDLVVQRGRAQDYVGMFSAAREVESLLATPEERARVSALQAFALAHLAEGDQQAPLEQALAKCDEALALTTGEQGRAQLQALRRAIAVRLAPVLARKADELFLHRRRDYFTLSEQTAAPPADAAEHAGHLAEAFERVAAMYQRAIELAEPAARAPIEAKLSEPRQLSEAARRLQRAFSGAR